MKKTLRSTSTSKWIISIIMFFIVIGISNDIYINQVEFISFYELVLLQFNSAFSLLFALSFLLIFFSASNEKEIERLPSNAALVFLKRAVISAVDFVAIILSANLAYCFVSRGFQSFVNNWSYNNSFSVVGLSPIACVVISVILFSLRCVFLFYLIILINMLTRKPYWGFWSVLFICFVDYSFYNQTHIPYPLNILPVEHTRVLFTRAFNSPMEPATRGSYLISILYWIILVLIIHEVIKFLVKERGERNEVGLHTRD